MTAMAKQVVGRILPRRGDFEGRTLAGPFAPDAASTRSGEPLFGMLPEALYLWGTLRDDEDDMHTITRWIPHNERPAGAT